MVKARKRKASQSKSTTAPITNYFSAIPTTKRPKPKSKSKQPQEIMATKQLVKLPVKPSSFILKDKKDTSKNMKRNRRRIARAKAKSQMEANVRKTEYENKRDNLKTECSKVYSLSIERRKRRRAVKKLKRQAAILSSNYSQTDTILDLSNNLSLGSSISTSTI